MLADEKKRKIRVVKRGKIGKERERVGLIGTKQ